ncbi:MAG: glycine cleavage system aminomethyltransferase GcvT [Bdellovibrionota bacterium]
MLKRTALFDEHQKLGGRLIDFGGWELPVQYTGVMDEHLACRRAAGLFDVSHMGEFHVDGTDSEAFLSEALTNNVAKLVDGQAQYTLLCNREGGVVDDLIVYKRNATKFLIVVNASNTEKDFAWMRAIHEIGKYTCRFTNESAKYSQIAIQGRIAESVVQKMTALPLKEIKYYHFAEGLVCGVPALVARTGYTGEDGFELYVPWAQGPAIWAALLKEGSPLGLKPCGLGARDTLRLEMKFPLYGHELSETSPPLEAGLGWVVKLDKAGFVGKEAIVRNKTNGLQRTLVGLQMIDRGIPRQGYPLFDSPSGGSRLGEVTSGTQSPSLQKAIAIGYVSRASAAPMEVGASLWMEIRGQRLKCAIASTPFYKRDY